MTMRRPFSAALIFIALALSAVSAPAADPADARRLYTEQHQHSLELRLRQSNARRAELSPTDARRLEQLHLQQRLEQHQLEVQQDQRDRAIRQNSIGGDPFVADRQAEAQRRIFAQERALQNQRFELDQQRLLQSMPRQPLQPPIGSSQLELR